MIAASVNATSSDIAVSAAEWASKPNKFGRVQHLNAGRRSQRQGSFLLWASVGFLDAVNLQTLCLSEVVQSQVATEDEEIKIGLASLGKSCSEQLYGAYI